MRGANLFYRLGLLLSDDVSGHHDKNFNHIRRLFRPRPKRVRGLTCVPSIGHYRDSLLSTSSSRRSFTTDSEDQDTDDNVLDSGQRQLDGQYDIIAKLWMEQVDAKAVKKSSTMFLSVLPPGQFRVFLNCCLIPKLW